jgi:methyl-accepting chemotaxis protein
VFATIWLVLNVFLHLMIIKRVNKIAAKAEEISKGDMTVTEFDQSGKDELSSLGHSFSLMYRSLSSAVKLLVRTQA